MTGLTSYEGNQPIVNYAPDRAAEHALPVPEVRPPVASFNADRLNAPGSSKTPVEQFEPKPIPVQPPGVPASGIQSGAGDMAAMRAMGYLNTGNGAGTHAIMTRMGSQRDRTDAAIQGALTAPNPRRQSDAAIHEVLTKGAYTPTPSNQAMWEVAPSTAPGNSQGSPGGGGIGPAVGQAAEEILPEVAEAAL